MRAQLHAAQQERKAALDLGRVDTTFVVGDQVMLRTKTPQRWASCGRGPFPVDSCGSRL